MWNQLSELMLFSDPSEKKEKKVYFYVPGFV